MHATLPHASALGTATLFAALMLLQLVQSSRRVIAIAVKLLPMTHVIPPHITMLFLLSVFVLILQAVATVLSVMALKRNVFRETDSAYTLLLATASVKATATIALSLDEETTLVALPIAAALLSTATALELTAVRLLQATATADRESMTRLLVTLRAQLSRFVLALLIAMAIATVLSQSLVDSDFALLLRTNRQVGTLTWHALVLPTPRVKENMKFPVLQLVFTGVRLTLLSNLAMQATRALSLLHIPTLFLPTDIGPLEPAQLH